MRDVKESSGSRGESGSNEGVRRIVFGGMGNEKGLEAGKDGLVGVAE